jgi:uncharacterized protein
MKCPKCPGSMQVIEYNGVEVDRCDNCHGLWFDHLEKEDLKRLEGAETLDIGDEFVGARYDRMQGIKCPKCSAGMVRVENTEPFEITFESCPSCRGSYFDAGEFRDYMEEEIFEQFQAVVASLNRV